MVSFAGYPLLVEDRLVGVLALFARRPLADDTLSALGAIADILAQGIERKRGEDRITQLNTSLERRVRERTEALLEANRELESFSYSVSHDLRAPLRHVLGFADMLDKRSGALLDENGRRYLRTIQESARHAGSLVDDLLAFSRMGRAELRQQRVAMDALVKQAQQDVSPELESRECAWSIDALPEVEGDAAMLRLVWRNLLSNAVKYTRGREIAEIRVSAEATPEEVVFTVRDNGVGFDMRYVDKLFGVFQRLHTSEEFEGTGIGLANVRRIVQRHGGRAWAEGVPGEGAAFHFSLPRNPRTAEPQP
jgi:light-regulated signal transduction histidine kinase (bacteriophytochrome)